MLPTHRQRSCLGTTNKILQHWRLDRDRMRLFDYDTTLQLWFHWDHIPSGWTRSSTLLFKRSHRTSEHISAHYDVASVLRTDNNAKVISTGTIQRDDTCQNHIEDWAIQYLALPEDGGEFFAKQVQANNGQTAGDGSCKDGRATGGFISFTNDDVQNGIEGATELPLTEDGCTTYAGKLGGILVAIAATH